MYKVHLNLSQLFQLFLLFQVFHSLKWNRRNRWNTLPAQGIPKNCHISFTIPLFHLFLFQKLSKGMQSYSPYFKMIPPSVHPKLGHCRRLANKTGLILTLSISDFKMKSVFLLILLLGLTFAAVVEGKRFATSIRMKSVKIIISTLSLI